VRVVEIGEPGGPDVLRVSERDSRPLAGGRVMGLVGGVGYSDEVVVPERETIRVPTDLALEEAGAIPEAFVTAWDAFGQADLRPGETVLIHAVGSRRGSPLRGGERELGEGPALVGRLTRQSPSPLRTS